VGVLKAKGTSPRTFSAQRFSCGDGILDGNEACDASAPAGDAACPARCTDLCVCGNAGTTSTTIASTTSTTNPTACVPTSEVCDGVDNDCDGVADEGSDLCTLPDAVAACVAGGCRVASCNTSFADCNKAAADGCEINTGTDPGNCGACGTACPATQICSSGRCAIPCNGVPGESCVTVEDEGLDERIDDTTDTAIPVVIGGLIEGTVGNPTDDGIDVDAYAFDAVAGDVLRVTISNRAGGTFQAGGVIASAEDALRWIRPGSTDASIATREFVVEQSGKLYLGISDARNLPFPGGAGGASFRYSAKVSRVSRMPDALVPPVVQQPGSVPDTGDVALFSFDAVERQEIMASTRAAALPTPSQVDTILLLFDASTMPPTLVAGNDDDGSSTDSLVDVPAPTSGSYLLVVDHYDVGGVAPADRQYDLTVTAPCFHCEALFHGSLGTGAACEESAGLFEKLVDCTCNGPCDAPCETECSLGGAVSEACDACIADPNGCGPEQRRAWPTPDRRPPRPARRRRPRRRW
jgi:hypothetical protein